MSLFVVNAPIAIAKRVSGPDAFRTTAFAAIVTLVVVAFLPGGMIAGGALAVAGLLLAVINLRDVRSSGGRFSLPLVLTFLGALLWISGVNWGAGFLNPLYMENLALHGGTSSIDAFFHAAYANMLATYHVPSTGIDGIPVVPYHFGSHVIFGGISSKMGTSMLDFYSLGYPLIVPPFWVMGFAILVDTIRRTRDPVVTAIPDWTVAVGLLAAALVGALPAPAVYAGGFGLGPFFSESYGLALPFLFLVTAVVVVAIVNALRKVERNTLSEAGVAIAFVPIALACVAALKVALMPLALAAFIYAVARLRLYRRPAWVAGVVLSLAAVMWISRYTVPRGYESGFQLFAYLKYVLPLPWWPFFITLHLFWFWLFTISRFGEEGISSFAGLRSAIARRSILDVELVFLVALLGMGPGLILPIGLDSYFFSDPQRWFALAMLLTDAAIAGKLAQTWSARRKEGFFGFAPRKLVLLLIAFPLAVSFAVTLMRWPLQMVRTNLATRNEISALAGSPVVSLRQRVKHVNFADLMSSSVITKGMSNARAGAMVSTLTGISAMPRSERKVSAFYIPKNVDAFWGMISESADCGYSSFAGPAIADMAMIDGFPPARCPVTPGYGMHSYGSAVTEQRVDVRSDADLCARARKWSLTQVIVVTPAASEAAARWPKHFDVRKISCTAAAG